MNILYYSPSPLDSVNTAVLLDDAFCKLNENKNVNIFFVICKGKFVNCCDTNYEASKIRCAECRFSNWLVFKKYTHPRLHLYSLSDFIKSNDMKKIKFSYTGINDIENIEYNNIRIGIGCVSSYVSATRNLNPKMNQTNVQFFDRLLQSSAYITDLLNAAIKEILPAEIVLYNGRFFSFRPLYELALKENIDCRVLEYKFSNRISNIKRVEFTNALPHSISNTTCLIKKNWDKFVDQENKERISSQFFENRRNGITAGDKVYIANQKTGLLPADWDHQKRNFVIFNSSEDEFFSIGDEWNKYKLFNSQIEGIKYILNMTKEQSDIHIYLRMHPNLAHVKFSYANAISELLFGYGNLTIIEANSPVSTYKLIDEAEKCIVFGSSVGIEANYWNKPVILLNAALYINLDVAYYPNCLSEINSLLLEYLPPKPRIGALMYGLYFYGDRGIDYKYINFNINEIKLLKKRLHIPKVYEYKGLIFPYLIILTFFRIINLLSHFHFKKIQFQKIQTEIPL